MLVSFTHTLTHTQHFVGLQRRMLERVDGGEVTASILEERVRDINTPQQCSSMVVVVLTP